MRTAVPVLHAIFCALRVSLAWTLPDTTSPGGFNKYTIVYPFKHFQTFNNQIYTLIHVPEQLQSRENNQICVILNNASDPILREQRTLLSKCLSPPNTHGHGAATFHLSFNIPFQNSRNNLLLSLSITHNEIFQAAKIPYRLESKIHDNKIISVTSNNWDAKKEKEHQDYKILHPRHGMTMEINRDGNGKYNIDVYIFVNNPSSNGIMCLTLDHQHENKLCLSQDVAQPIRFVRTADGNNNHVTNQLHVLKLEKVINIHENVYSFPSKNLKLIDSIIFMAHYTKTMLPTIQIVSPKHLESIAIKNVQESVVYFKFMLTGIKSISSNIQPGDQNGFLLCFVVQNDGGTVNFKSCNGITNEPLKLVGLGVGRYKLSAYLSNMFENEIIGTKTSTIVFHVNEEKLSLLVQDVELNIDGTTASDDNDNGYGGFNNILKSSCPVLMPQISYNIHIFAYHRPLKKLFESLSNAYYHYCETKIKINIIVFIDILNVETTTTDVIHNGERKKRPTLTNIIIKEVERFQLNWSYGSVKYFVAKKKLGLVNNIMQSFDIYDDVNSDANSGATSDDTRVILLEDDIVVSKFFMYYILQVDSYVIQKANTGSDGGIFGISLYRPLWNDIKWCSVNHSIMNNESSVYLQQLPSSWGALYYVKQWKLYVKWHKRTKNKNIENQFFIPESMSNTWKTSWKLPLLYYMLVNEKYLVYPAKASFSTTSTPLGENIKDESLKYLYSVPLLDNVGDNDVLRNILENFQYDLFKLTVDALPRYNMFHDLVNSTDITFNVNAMNPINGDNTNRMIGSTVTCEEHIESTLCKFANVGFSIPSKSNGNFDIILFDNYYDSAVTPRLRSILFPNTFRHRCCMEEVPNNIAVKYEPGSYQFLKEGATVKNTFSMCKNTLQGDTFMFSMVNFPQHGHTIHDTLLSLFVTISEHQKVQQRHRKINFIISNLNDKNLKSLIDLKQYKQILFKLLLKFSNEKVVYESILDNIYMLSELPEQLLCIDNLIYGISSRSSFYSNNDFFNMKEKYVTSFLTFYRNALHVGNRESHQKIYSPTIHYVERTNNRVVLNKKELLQLCKDKYDYNVVKIRFEVLTLKEQVERMEEYVNILVGATGTGLFNILFMKTLEAKEKHHVVILFPFGTFPYMGNNIINMAKFKGINVHILESKDPYKNVFLGVDTRSNNLLKMKPEKIWSENWLNGYSIYMQQNFHIEKDEFESIMDGIVVDS